MATYVPPKRGVALTFYVSLVSQANTKLMQVNPTLAAGDVQISKDGGAFANLTTLPAVTPAAGRAVKVDLSATEMTADNVVVQFVDAAGAEWCDLFVGIQTAARQIDDLATPTNITAATGVTLAAVTHTGAVIPTVSAVTGLTPSNLDVAVSSRMATYAHPTGFLAATFPAGTVANTTNITGGTITTTTNLTNLPAIPANWLTAAGIAADAITAAKLAADASTEIAAAVNTVALVESYRANGAQGTLTQLLYEILAHLTEASIAGTTKTVKKIDHTTVAATATLDSATAPTSITRAT